MLMNLLLSFAVFCLLCFFASVPGLILYVIIGIGWAAYLRYQGSPWLWIEAAFWPTSIYISFFDRSF